MNTNSSHPQDKGHFRNPQEKNIHRHTHAGEKMSNNLSLLFLIRGGSMLFVKRDDIAQGHVHWVECKDGQRTVGEGR